MVQSAGARILHQQHLLEGVAAVREHGLGKALHAAVEGAHERECARAASSPIATSAWPIKLVTSRPVSSTISRPSTRTEARHVPARAAGPGVCDARQHQQRAVHQLQDEVHHQHRHQHRHPDQQAIDQVAAQRAHQGSRSRRGRGCGLVHRRRLPRVAARALLRARAARAASPHAWRCCSGARGVDVVLAPSCDLRPGAALSDFALVGRSGRLGLGRGLVVGARLGLGRRGLRLRLRARRRPGCAVLPCPT